MSGRTLTVLLGLSLVSGCGQSYQPTVRRVSYQVGDPRTSPAQEPPSEEMECPGTKTHASASELKGGEKAREARAQLKERASARRVDPEVLKIGVGGSTAGAPAAGGGSRDVTVGTRRLVAPAGWTRGPALGGLMFAAFTVPRVEGDASDAQLTVNPVAQNDARSLDKLRAQLADDVKQGRAERVALGNAEAVVSETTGDSRDESDPFPAPVSEGRYKTLDATVLAEGVAFTVQCTGPETTVSRRAGEFRAFLQTLTR